MGKIYTKLFAKKPVKLIISGLDASGKSTMLFKLKLGEVTTTIPIIGNSIFTFSLDLMESFSTQVLA